MSNFNKTDYISNRLRKLSKKDVQKRDVFGRTIIHIICILGRFDFLDVLLENQHLNIKVADYENGWTALHCSIYYGKFSCARILVDHSYELMKLKDRNGLTALDIYHLKYSYKDLNIFPKSLGRNNTNYTQRFSSMSAEQIKKNQNLMWWDPISRGGSDVFTFGVNVNNNLGTGDSDDRLNTPYKIEIPNFRINDFSIENIADRLLKPRIRDIKLSKNHAVILTNEDTNNILIVGNPSRGRLGLNSLKPNYHFELMEYFQDTKIIQVALSDDHTLVLTKSGEVYSWGLNNFYELGYQTEKIKEKIDVFSNEPRRVSHTLKKMKIKGISCSKIHSAAYADNSLVLWGLNLGQMDFFSTGETVKHGKYKGIIQIPRTIEFSSKIKQVLTTEDSTIILLENDECHILINHSHLKFQLPLYKSLNNDFEIFRPTTFSKQRSVIKLVSKDSSKIGILYNDGSVSNFGVDIFSKASNIKYIEIWKPRSNHLKCVDVDIGNDGSVIVCTRSGCVYKRISRKNDSMKAFKFTKIEKISKVVKVSCDSLFTSFGFIKDEVDQLPLELSRNKFKVDIGKLSPLYKSIHDRKQNEFINQEDAETYTIDFLHTPKVEIDEDDISGLLQSKFSIDDNQEENEIHDPILNHYRGRWSNVQQLTDTFQNFDNAEHVELLKREDLKYQLTINDFNSGKYYDIKFEINNCFIGCHSSILKFSPTLSEIRQKDLEFENEIKFRKLKDGIIKVEGLKIQSLLIMLHIFYTGDFLKPWKLKSELKDLKNETLQLLTNFNLLDDLKRLTFNFFDTYNDLDNFENDILIKLFDNESIECCSFILKSRNAFFETLFSQRWDASMVIEFPHIKKDVFRIALNYIYGHEQLSLLNGLEITNITDFINFQFELIELSDEILSFGLKDLCQLMIKDFINAENVLVILHHSELLNCQKLIGECLWFIYNNFDLIIVDTNYKALVSTHMVQRIDNYCRWLNRVNKLNPSDDKLSWYDDDANILVKKFLKDDLREFNDIFLEDDSFVPLFDIPSYKVKLNSPKLEPSKSNKAPPLPTVTPLTEKQEDQRQPFNSVMSRNASFSDTSAIEFTDDDDNFQPVINSRRRKSSANRRSSNNLTASTPISTKVNSVNISRRVSTPSKTIPIPTRSSVSSNTSTSMYLNTNQSSGGINDNSVWPYFAQQSENSPRFVSPLNSWGNQEPAGYSYSPISSTPSISWWSTNENSRLEIGNNNNNKYNNINDNDGSNGKNNTSTKVNFNRLSQKERKKLFKTEEVSTGDKPSTPWKIPTPTKVEKPSPSLLAAQEEELAIENNKIPSLRGIIHEEEHKIVQEATERKSLADIQQEEEFAQWWEAESKKVQMQLNDNPFATHNGNGNSSNGHGKTRKASQNKSGNNNSKKKSFDVSKQRKKSVP
ncbi:hypothetical protein WICMUC_005512 [Wickerhamomyces mucosus]|uniref:BTB domain-containing protein n=1 Tax=Wickerhamomyces mucosus TaxID=1378264 RepID=A0A9P8T637_9ASCO|nr:hypothetical protein WICMUC_005512 [Wickerhamomyces mucosus]